MASSLHRRSFFRSSGTGLAGAAALGTAATHALTAYSARAAGPLPIDSTPLAPVGRGLIDSRKVLLWENTRKEIRDWMKAGKLKAAILPTGSVEQHNEHMAMVADVAISTLISQQIALELYPNVVVAPPSPCGYAPYHMARKGTITLRKETLQAYVLDVLESLKAHGIQTILVLNGHGGNHAPLLEPLDAWRKKLGITLEVDSYWNGIPKAFQQKVMTAQQPTSHAGEFETSIYMAAFPGRLRHFTIQAYDQAMLDYESGFNDDVKTFLRRDDRTFKQGQINVDGYNAADRRRQVEALLAKRETGEALISKATESFTQRLREMLAVTAAGKPWPAPA
ncbi:MAG: creatininase family protein [Planctomycetota bacterium]|nr:creatininase family protein [Planctomycetota bacterium]